MFEEIISLENLFEAWEEFLPGKRKRKDVRMFSRALFHNVLSLHGDLVAGSYSHSEYEAFIVLDPKRRNIHKASVRDRLLHHAIYRILYPVFDRTFIFDSYSCRNGKGTHKAFARLVTFARKVSLNYSEPCWAIQMDIRKFFDSVDHGVLIGLLSARVLDPEVMGLLTNIIHSFEHSPGKGMPLGNLTSQLFANVYMDPLDQFVKHQLKARYYLRYADDFLILGRDRHELMGYFVEIVRFLRESLHLDLHPTKIELRKFSQGIDFVGYMARPHYEIPRTKTVKRMGKKIEIEKDREKLGAMIASYKGHLSHVNAYRVIQELGVLE